MMSDKCSRCTPGADGEPISVATFNEEICEHVARAMQRKPFVDELAAYLANINAVVVTREAQARGYGPSPAPRNVTQADIDRWLFQRDAVVVASDLLEDLATILDTPGKVPQVQARLLELAHVRRGPRPNGGRR